jgi:MPBQ/MSBQ methyltransferase
MEAKSLLRWYDSWMAKPIYAELYEYSGFFNMGYWEAGAMTQSQACQDLMGRLLEFLPERHGCLVDMACGKGATTDYLLEHCPEMSIIGANLSLNQLRLAHQTVQGTPFAVMDAARPALANGCVEAVLCVEAAFHFQTRQHFLEEAYRILKPGGYLVLTDILLRRSPENSRPYMPTENYLPDERAYRAQMLAAGFSGLEILDATQACWHGCLLNLQHWAMHRLRVGQIGPIDFLRLLCVILVCSFIVRRYLLIAAQKPK